MSETGLSDKINALALLGRYRKGKPLSEPKRLVRKSAAGIERPEQRVEVLGQAGSYVYVRTDDDDVVGYPLDTIVSLTPDDPTP